jgi:RNA polymerase sigma factor (sigma-70 family)
VETEQILAEQFEEHRTRLRAVAYRMLGSVAEAEDAVQEAWLRLSRSDHAEVENLGGWLTTVVSRICLDMLRTRASRREESLESRLPDPLVTDGDAVDPEQEAMLAEAVGLAMLVVLQELSPAERLAFVLHDMFAIPFGDIAPILGRSPDATKMMASRARRRVQSSRVTPDADLSRQREVVDAFLGAARDGDLETLVGVLHPEVVLRSDGPEGLRVLRGATTVASGAATFAAMEPLERLVLVNGAVGVLASREGELLSVASFLVVDGRITEINIVADPARLAALGVTL